MKTRSSLIALSIAGVACAGAALIGQTRTPQTHRLEATPGDRKSVV